MFLFCDGRLEPNRTIHGSHIYICFIYMYASKLFVLDTKRKVCEFVGQYTGSLSNTYLIIKHKIDTFLGAYFFLLWNLSLTRISLSPFKKQEHLLVFYFWAFWVATVLPRASWEDGGLRERKERASVKWQSTLLRPPLLVSRRPDPPLASESAPPPPPPLLLSVWGRSSVTRPSRATACCSPSPPQPRYQPDFVFSTQNRFYLSSFANR